MPHSPHLPSVLSILQIVLFASLSAACSEADIQREFNSYLENHRACETPDDCTVILPGCPLGCGTVVAAEYAEEAQALAERLIKRYEMTGPACAYRCAAPPAVTCEDQICGLSEE